MQLSIRMQAVADMVTPGGRIADIGTDHGYVPIYLVEQNKIDHAIEYCQIRVQRQNRNTFVGRISYAETGRG